MKFKILASLLAIVLIAGCSGIPGMENLGLGTGTIGGGNGLEMTSFSAEPTPVYSGSKVRIMVDVANQGGTTVPKNKALVYLTGSDVDLGSSGTSYWRGDTNSTNAYKSFTKDMRAADVVKGTSADTARFSWTLIAPNITAGQTRTDTFFGRVYCDYSTAVNGNVWIYTEGEADAAKASNRPINLASFTSTAGPVGLNVKVSPDPVIYYASGETFSLYITVSNLASGTIYTSGKTYSTSGFSISADDYNKVNIDVKYDSNKIRSQNLADCTGSQELPAGKSTTLVCDFQVLGSPTTFVSLPITVTANYGYYTERTATVVVQGK
jgi:hypothetical protein